jgi:hypothetical protein
MIEVVLVKLFFKRQDRTDDMASDRIGQSLFGKRKHASFKILPQISNSFQSSQNRKAKTSKGSTKLDQTSTVEENNNLIGKIIEIQISPTPQSNLPNNLEQSPWRNAATTTTSTTTTNKRSLISLWWEPVPRD